MRPRNILIPLLSVLQDNLDILPAVGGAVEDLLRPDVDEVEDMLLGKNICMETSFSLDYLPPERARMFFDRHPGDFLIFGSDSPWADQTVCLRQHRQLGLEPGRLDRILGGNACRLLGIL